MSEDPLEIDRKQLVVPDFIKEDLDILFVGINPGVTSGQLGHHYCFRGNHFWPCFNEANLVPVPFTFNEDFRLLEYGIGFTNVCSRVTKGMEDLTKEELRNGCEILRLKIKRFRPKIVAFVGKGIYELFVGRKNVALGRQPGTIQDTQAIAFVMPSSSGRVSPQPRTVFKTPFFVALRELRDSLKVPTKADASSSSDNPPTGLAPLDHNVAIPVSAADKPAPKRRRSTASSSASADLAVQNALVSPYFANNKVRRQASDEPKRPKESP